MFGLDVGSVLGFWSPFIIDVDPSNKIVWEFHKWDNIGTGPDQFDINYMTPEVTPLGAAVNWSYFNGVDYDPKTDRLIVTDRQFSEVYMIDRKTRKVVCATAIPRHGELASGPDSPTTAIRSSSALIIPPSCPTVTFSA